MTDQPEALRLADALDCRGHRSPDWQDQLDAASELRRLHVANAELTECLERKSIAIQRIWKERDELRAEVERLRAELARLTTLRPANEWDGETYVLWWREWDEAGWVIDSVSDSQESGWWTPVFDVSLPDVKETK